MVMRGVAVVMQRGAAIMGWDTCGNEGGGCGNIVGGCGIARGALW